MYRGYCMSRFFISDTHFGDSNIIRYENRPFADIGKMNTALIENWNSVVSPDDEVYVVGDFCTNFDPIYFLSKLNGKKYLIKGNHDTMSNKSYRESGFTEVYDKPIILDNFWILSHEPMYINENMPYVNIFGHVHSNPAIKDYSPYSFCVSVERINYTPISFTRIKETLCEEFKRELK